jgi:hypothetical protein
MAKMRQYLPFLGFTLLGVLVLCFSYWNNSEDQEKVAPQQDIVVYRLKMEIGGLKELVKTLEAKNREKVPSKEHELARLKVQRDVNEFWNFVRANFEKNLEEANKNKDNGTVLLLEKTLKSGRHRYNVIKRDLEVLSGKSHSFKKHSL